MKRLNKISGKNFPRGQGGPKTKIEKNGRVKSIHGKSEKKKKKKKGPARGERATEKETKKELDKARGWGRGNPIPKKKNAQGQVGAEQNAIWTSLGLLIIRQGATKRKRTSTK